MIKHIVSFLLIVAVQFVNGQDLVVVSKVQSDSISIKWLPNNFQQYKSSAGGAVVSRIESSATEGFESLDFSSAKTWKIPPVNKELASGEDKYGTLLAPLFESGFTEEQANFAFGTALIENVINPEFQFLLGNILVDTDFPKNKSFVYKIEVKGEKAVYVTVNSKQDTEYMTIDDLELSLDQNKTVDVQWMAKRYEKEAFGFEIEHSMDEISEGQFLTDTPFLPFTSYQQIAGSKTLYRDTPEPGHFHFYRIHGRDMFGHKELISDWKKIYVPYLISAAATIDTIYATETERVIEASIHHWTDEVTVNKVSLFRSENRDGDYVLVDTKSYSDSIVEFKMNETKTGDHFYYKVQLSNKDSEVFSTQRYFFTLDQEPPNPPTNLSGTIDSNGVVQLKWTRPEDKDIEGYRVFRANSKREEFIEKTTRLSAELAFVDTLRLDNLTSEVYYTIQSVDHNMNQSMQSDTLLLLKPDTIPPVPAVIKTISMQDGMLEVQWTNSDSDDIKMNHLLKYFKSRTDTLFSWTGRDASFLDTNVSGGNYYHYGIVTIDKSENRSESNSMTQFYEPGYRDPLLRFEATVDLKKKVVVLTWKAPNEPVFSYQIFRGKADEKLLPLKTISDESVHSFEDKNVRINNKYVYTVKFVTKSGIHSIPAKIEVIYQ